MVAHRDEAFRQAEEIWADNTDDNGRVDLATVRSELAQWLTENPDKSSAAREADTIVDRLDRQKRPHEDVLVGQQSFDFYNAEAFLPVGESERVQMKKLSKEDLARWWIIETTNKVRQDDRYSNKWHWYQRQLSDWQPQHQTLGDVRGP